MDLPCWDWMHLLQFGQNVSTFDSLFFRGPTTRKTIGMGFSIPWLPAYLKQTSVGFKFAGSQCMLKSIHSKLKSPEPLGIEHCLISQKPRLEGQQRSLLRCKPGILALSLCIHHEGLLGLTKCLARRPDSNIESLCHIGSFDLCELEYLRVVLESDGNLKSLISFQSTRWHVFNILKRFTCLCPN